MTMPLLDGVRVLDLGILAAGPYCAKLLGDAGADVIHVERPDGDPSRDLGPFAPDDTDGRFSATFAFLNANKRSVNVDFTTQEGRAVLWRLIDWADILVENFRPGTLARHGFGDDALLARRPDLVQVSISNYGRTGPYRDFAATELTLQAMAGMMDGNGDLDREPLRYPGQTVQMMAGANAAYAALVAYRHARRTGRGQVVDVSIQESMATTYYSLFADYQYTGALQARGQKDLYPTADGLFMARWLSSRPWDEFALAFDAPELAVEPALHPPLALTANAGNVADVLSNHLQTRPRRDWFARAIEHGITAGMLQSLDEVLECPHLAARSFWDTITTADGHSVKYPGSFYTVNGDRGSHERRAPALGEHNAEAAALPARTRVTPNPAGSETPALRGIRVVDNGIVQAGTFPARLLADFGADVVRVENYLRPDLSRNVVYPEGGPDDQYWEQGGTYHEQHRNKGACIGLDASRPEGRAAFLQLCAVSDVVLDSHPPGVLDRLGLGYDALREARPDIILVTTAGYGHGGPYSTNRSFGMMTELMCGLSALNGYPGEPSRRGTVPFTDHETVYHIAMLMLAALERRDRTGEGAWIDVSQYEVGINMLGDAYVSRALGASLRQQGNADPPHPFAGCYRCRGEDAWITLSVTCREAWEALLSVIGRLDLAVRFDPWRQPLTKAERGEIDQAITAWTELRGPDECMAEFQRRGIAAGMVADVRDLLLDPHLAERGFFWLVDHYPEQGAGRRAWPGASARLAVTPGTLLRPAPMLGEHNQEILCDLLGYGEEAYRMTEAAGGIGTTPLAAGTRPAARPITTRLHAGPWAMGRIKCHDPDVVTRLRERFGAGYGREMVPLKSE
jgi:crotonobetainyl-CoA:carnitine CoA-transferase CaiB-like acyl-CoA transferase